MFDWIVQQIPWWAWGILALAALGAVGFFWRNVKGLIIIAAGLAGVVLLRHAEQSGYNKRDSEIEEKTDALDQDYDDIQNRPDKSRDDLYNGLLDRNKDKR